MSEPFVGWEAAAHATRVDVEQLESGAHPAEAEVLALAATFDARLTEAERRMDRLLARLGVE